MKKHIVLFLVITLLGMNCATYEKGEGINLEPGQKPGAKLVIQKKDGQQVKGELIAVKKDSLLLKDSQTGADVSVDIADIKMIKIVKKSKTGKGALYGFGLAGAGAGLIGLSLDPEETGMTRKNNVIFCVIVFGGMGALAGLIVGGFLGIDKKIMIEGKSDSEIQEILEDLRKKARVPDFQ